MQQDKYACTRQLLDLVFDSGAKKHVVDRETEYLRPGNFEIVRAGMSGWHPEVREMWLRFLAVLEADPGLWFDVSW